MECEKEVIIPLVTLFGSASVAYCFNSSFALYALQVDTRQPGFDNSSWEYDHTRFTLWQNCY